MERQASRPVSLAKPSDFAVCDREEQIPAHMSRPLINRTRRGQSVLPWYPLVGHRPGLRMNDLSTLASAIFILALEGGTAHQSLDLTESLDLIYS